jgi:hypothetical protein
MRHQVVPASIFVLFLALGLGSSGCASNQPEPQWIEREFGAGTDQLLMDCTALAIQKTGFPVGSGIDPGRLVAVSGWQISLQPFRGKGWREQCEVRFERLEKGRYKASIRVRHEKNDDILHPLDLTYAQWVPEPDNTLRARSVMQHIQSRLGTGVEIGTGR